MNYRVRIAVVCVVDGEPPEDGYTQDIQVHIVNAIDFEDAFEKALEIGKNEEHEYRNEAGERVRWKFREVEATSMESAEPPQDTVMFSFPLTAAR